MVVFSYIIQALEAIKKKWEESSVFWIVGESKIGKTFLLHQLESQYSDDEYCFIYLNGSEQYCGDYAPFQLANLSLIDRKSMAKNYAVKINEGMSYPVKNLVEIIINHSEIKRKTTLFALNETERYIISRVMSLCKKRKVVFFADNYALWDSNSQKLMAFMFEESTQKAFAFLQHSKLIIAVDSDKNISMSPFRSSRIINLTPYRSLDFYKEQLHRVNPSFSDAFVSQMFVTSGGNLGMTYSLLEMLSLIEQSYTSTLNSEKNPQFIRVIHDALQKRIETLDKLHAGYKNALEYASVLGFKFKYDHLHAFSGISQSMLNYLLQKAYEAKMLLTCDEHEYEHEFYNGLLHHYFYHVSIDDKKEYHRKLAELLRKMRPFDYYLRYYHLLNAGAADEAHEMLCMYLTRIQCKGIVPSANLVQTLSREAPTIYKDYELLCKALQSQDIAEVSNILDCIDATSGYRVLLERDYVLACKVYSLGAFSRYSDAMELLVEHIRYMHNDFSEIRLRMAMLLYIFYVNRLMDATKARKIEKSIVFELAQRSSEDRYWTSAIHTLNRNSGAIYNTEVAIIKVKKAVDYFSMTIDTNLEDYIMALTNYAALLILLARFNEAFQHTTMALELIEQHDLRLFRVDKVINNLTISGFFAGEMSSTEAKKVYALIIRSSEVSNTTLIRNNHLVMCAYCGETARTFNGYCEELRNPSVVKHNDYYYYLFQVNLISAAILCRDYELAKRIFSELDYMIPAIMKSEEKVLQMRYNAFRHLIDSEKHYETAFDLETAFGELIPMGNEYIRKPFILSDQQFWSALE